MLAELLAIVVPPACVACRAALPRAELRLCAACVRALPWLPAQRCERCGLPRHRRGCPAAGAAFARAWSPLAYEGVARELVAALKFRGALPLAALMAAHIAANLPPELRHGALVPGAGAAAAAAEDAASTRRRRSPRPSPRASSYPSSRACAAATAAPRQVGASRTQRRRPDRLTIDLRAPPPARALLVDDVHTTGATLDACARALVAGGCREVVAITYARTL